MSDYLAAYCAEVGENNRLKSQLEYARFGLLLAAVVLAVSVFMNAVLIGRLDKGAGTIRHKISFHGKPASADGIEEGP